MSTTRRRSKQRIIGPAIWRHIKLFVVLMLAYLVQSCVMPYFTVFGITPSLVIVAMSIVTVAFGRIRAFWAGAFFGIILETMQPTKSLLNLLLYPICSLLGAVIFADKSTQQLEYERSIGKAGRNISPLVRTPLCTLFNITLYDIVNIAYIYLRGADITFTNIGRGLFDIFLTTLLCIVIMVPVRHFLGFRHRVDLIRNPKPYLD